MSEDKKIDIVMGAVPGRLHSTEAKAILAALCKAGFAVVRVADYLSETPSTGEVIGQMNEALKDRSMGANLCVVMRGDLQSWHDCMVEAAAMLDPDNPPLVPEQLQRMKPRQR